MGRTVQHVAAAVQVPDEARHAALEEEVLLRVGALVGEADPQALVEVGRFAQAGADRLPAEVERLEDLRVRSEEGARPVVALPRRIETAVRLGGSAALLDRSLRRASDELLVVTLAVAQDLDPHLGAQGVHDARADAVEAAGDLVATPAELTAGVELGHDHLECALPGPVPVDRDAAPVVDHLERSVRVDDHVDPGRLVGHRLVDAVVDDLPDEVMQAAAIGRADVHARAQAHRLEALENLDVLGGVARRRLAACPRCSLDGHADGSSSWSGVTGIAASADGSPFAPRVMIE